MNEDKLAAVAQQMWDGATAIRNVDGNEVQAVAFALVADEIRVIMLAPVPYEYWRNVLVAMAGAGADIVGTCSEAWGVKVEQKDQPAYDAASALGVRNEDRPDRFELLQVVAEDATGRIVGLRAEIKDGRVGEPNLDPPGTQFGGRLTGVFKR